MSRARQPDGSEQLHLHMGYFETLADADRWVEAVRRHYPNAFATIAPLAFLRPANSEAPSMPPAAPQPVVSQSSDSAPVNDESLTDTQVLKILETRRVSAVQDDVDERNCDQIALLRPDDTSTRQALKEAVVQGAPVSFAVQLQWSAQPIDLSRVPSPAIFFGWGSSQTRSLRSKSLSKRARSSPRQLWCPSLSRRSRAHAKPAWALLQSRVSWSNESIRGSIPTARQDRRHNNLSL